MTLEFYINSKIKPKTTVACWDLFYHARCVCPRDSLAWQLDTHRSEQWSWRFLAVTAPSEAGSGKI